MKMMCNQPASKKLLIYRYWSGMTVITLVVIICWYLEMFLNGYEMPRDSYDYLRYFKLVLEKGISAARAEEAFMGSFPPLMTVLTVGLARLGIPLEIAGRGLNGLGMILTGTGVFTCAWQILRRKRYALPTAFLVMSLPKIYQASSGILRDPLYWGICLWLLAVLIWMLNRDWKALRPADLALWVLPGVLAGIALLCRKEAVLLIAAVFCIVPAVLMYPSWRRWPFGAAAVIGMTAGIGLVLLLMWWSGIPNNILVPLMNELK